MQRSSSIILFMYMLVLKLNLTKIVLDMFLLYKNLVKCYSHVILVMCFMI